MISLVSTRRTRYGLALLGQSAIGGPRPAAALSRRARTYQTTGQDKLANIGNRRYAMARRQRGQLPAPVVEQDIGTDKQCAGAPLNDSRKCSIDFAYGLRIQDQEATSEFACSGRHLFFLHFETRGPGLPQPSNGGWRRHQLMQQP